MEALHASLVSLTSPHTLHDAEVRHQQAVEVANAEGRTAPSLLEFVLGKLSGEGIQKLEAIWFDLAGAAAPGRPPPAARPAAATGTSGSGRSRRGERGRGRGLSRAGARQRRMIKDPLVDEAARRGGAVEAAVGAVAEAQGSLAVSQRPGAAEPAEDIREDDLPTQPMAPAEEAWQDALRRVPQGPAARGPQATLQQIFARQADKGSGRGPGQEYPRDSPY